MPAIWPNPSSRWRQRAKTIEPVPGGMRGSRPRRRVEELELGNAVMREVVEVAGKDPGAGLRCLSDRGKTLLIDRLGPACSPGSMTCLPGIAPGGRLLPPRRARG